MIRTVRRQRDRESIAKLPHTDEQLETLTPKPSIRGSPMRAAALQSLASVPVASDLDNSDTNMRDAYDLWLPHHRLRRNM